MDKVLVDSVFDMAQPWYWRGCRAFDFGNVLASGLPSTQVVLTPLARRPLQPISANPRWGLMCAFGQQVHADLLMIPWCLAFHPQPSLLR
jgi:hypothetical protein